MRRRRRNYQPDVCFYCGRGLQKKDQKRGDFYTRDHYHPKSKGGRHTVPCCLRCNQLKANRTARDFCEEWWGKWHLMPEYQVREKRTPRNLTPI